MVYSATSLKPTLLGGQLAYAGRLALHQRGVKSDIAVRFGDGRYAAHPTNQESHSGADAALTLGLEQRLHMFPFSPLGLDDNGGRPRWYMHRQNRRDHAVPCQQGRLPDGLALAPRRQTLDGFLRVALKGTRPHYWFVDETRSFPTCPFGSCRIPFGRQAGSSQRR